MGDELWDTLCPSCREQWPRRAFRVLRFFRSRRCQVCRKCGPRFARFVHYMRWPLGIPESHRAAVAPPQ